MNKLLEIKNRAVKFYGEHQSYLFPIVYFLFIILLSYNPK